jgi:TRAP transporter TAXI family solute receptor
MMLRALVITGLAMSLGAPACRGKAETSAQPRKTVRTAKTTANEFRHALERMPTIDLEVATEGGSSINSLIDLHQKKTDIVSPLADVVYLAYAGQLDEFRDPFDQLRGMAVIGLNTIHLLVGRNARVDTLRDLKGLRVSHGPPGSSLALITPRMLEAHGLQPADVHGERIPNTELVNRLARGEIDAAFYAAAVPASQAIVAMQDGARLIGIEGPPVEELRTQYPYLKGTLIPAGTYPNQSKAIRTISVDLVLVCRADLDEDTVYELLDAYFATRPATTPPNLERAPATPIPLHAGASRYYRQRQLAR